MAMVSSMADAVAALGADSDFLGRLAPSAASELRESLAPGASPRDIIAALAECVPEEPPPGVTREDFEEAMGDISENSAQFAALKVLLKSFLNDPDLRATWKDLRGARLDDHTRVGFAGVISSLEKIAQYMEEGDEESANDILDIFQEVLNFFEERPVVGENAENVAEHTVPRVLAEYNETFALLRVDAIAESMGITAPSYSHTFLAAVGRDVAKGDDFDDAFDAFRADVKSRAEAWESKFVAIELSEEVAASCPSVETLTVYLSAVKPGNLSEDPWVRHESWEDQMDDLFELWEPGEQRERYVPEAELEDVFDESKSTLLAKHLKQVQSHASADFKKITEGMSFSVLSDAKKLELYRLAVSKYIIAPNARALTGTEDELLKRKEFELTTTTKERRDHYALISLLKDGSNGDGLNQHEMTRWRLWTFAMDVGLIKRRMYPRSALEADVAQADLPEMSQVERVKMEVALHCLITLAMTTEAVVEIYTLCRDYTDILKVLQDKDAPTVKFPVDSPVRLDQLPNVALWKLWDIVRPRPGQIYETGDEKYAMWVRTFNEDVHLFLKGLMTLDDYRKNAGARAILRKKITDYEKERGIADSSLFLPLDF